jgi:3-oxoacyl-[acyl-carrier protein] reductase
MDLRIKGRTALVLGGSKGLGWGVASALAAEGVHVALLARGQAALDSAARELAQRYGVEAHGFAADLADADGLIAAVAAAEAALGGRVDILLNNSGGPPPSGIAGIDPALWSAQFEAMVLSLVRVTDRVLPAMRAGRWGRILTVASTVVVEPNPALALSNSLRSTLVGWSKTLAGEVARDGITVNLLLPGQIATDRTVFLDATAAERRGTTADAIKAAKLETIPAGRYGTPEEFGAIAAFLASDHAAYVTGSMIRVDGGVVRSV